MYQTSSKKSKERGSKKNKKFKPYDDDYSLDSKKVKKKRFNISDYEDEEW